MNDTIDIVVAQHQNFFSLDHANAAGYSRPWQLKRRERKPDGSEPRASLYDAVLPDDLDDFQRGIYLRSPDLVWFGDKIGINHRILYHISQTKPYNPTERTRAVWAYQDVFVAEWKRYRYHDTGRWYEVEVSEYRDGVNETKIMDHLRGKERSKSMPGVALVSLLPGFKDDAAERALARQRKSKKVFCHKVVLPSVSRRRHHLLDFQTTQQHRVCQPPTSAMPRWNSRPPLAPRPALPWICHLAKAA